jgi:hypothetical protein
LYVRLFEKIIFAPAFILTGRFYLVEKLYSNKGNHLNPLEGNSAESVEDCLQHLTEISQAAHFYLERIYLSAFGQINSKIDEDLKNFPTRKRKRIRKVTTCTNSARN